MHEVTRASLHAAPNHFLCGHLQSTKEEIDRVNLEVQSAERDYDLNRAAELKYGTLTELQKQLREAEAALEAKVRV